ncbi:tRNA 2-selenouridine(34) synthase MnmH [Candidatus Aalborgicola defluviihabitans]|uniref:tRNA 2-selenouridine(34) synthase MnmH n=1 Tax=Candidatus Aalborgicola defluviihabitans TaxID=3386187 RepID=UPI001EB70861|nr:tRNA 2-selenouridine(34) synthase MnmH [Burkholderiales bacterium]
MSLNVLNATEVLAQLDAFDTVIDARSESEFALDHLPGAVNWPTLNDEERKAVGTLYVQVNQFEAKKRGAAIAARNIAAHIERDVIDKPREWKPLAYCWRGGKRSGSLTLILDQIGFRVTLVEGGYKAFRVAMLQDITLRAQKLDWRVVCGTTGSGKTRLLHALRKAGAQVLDLEGLANHRSSVLGAIPGLPQPSQKRFDTLIWDALRQFDPAQPVFVESESKKVGNVAIPAALVERMRASPCLDLTLPTHERVALLLEDYDFFVQDSVHFCERLDVLAEFRGKAVVQAWKDQIHSGNFEPVVQELLTQHYDPVYRQSMLRNFTQYPQARAIAPDDHSMNAMGRLARQLLDRL